MKTLKQIKVLVVEDNPSTLESLVAYFQALGHEAVPAGNGLGAEVGLAAFRPDAVVVDHIMPALDGLGFLRRLRADPAWAGTPVVMITALADGPELRALRDALGGLQPARLLRKPFEPRALLETLHEMPRAAGVGDGRADINLGGG